MAKVTKQTLEKILKKMDKNLQPTDTVYHTALFMLASAHVGPNIRRIQKLTELPLGRVQKLTKMARKNKIFVGSKLAVEWFEKDGGIAFWCDAMVLDGLLQRTTKND